MRIIVFLGLFFCSPILFWGQKVHDSGVEEELKLYADHFLNLSSTDAEKDSCNRLFIEQLSVILQESQSLNYSFESIKNLSVRTSPDGRVRTYTWFLLSKNYGYKSFGFLQYLDDKRKIHVFELKEMEDFPKGIMYKTLGTDNWYGCLYFDIVEYSYKKEKIYVLLGFDGNDGITSRKVIETLTFSNNKPRFGDNLFYQGNKSYSRIIFEYSAQITMGVRYDAKRKWIVFDHLSPENQGLVGQYQFYGPDFSYDAFQFYKGKFRYLSDIDARNDTENEGVKKELTPKIPNNK